MSTLTTTKPQARETTPVESATATFYAQKGSNDTFFRAEAPAEAVGGKVVYIQEKNLERATTYPNQDTGLKWQIEFQTPNGPKVARTKLAYQRLTKEHIGYTDVAVSFPEHEGVAVWTRPCGRRSLLAQYMRREGIVTVGETDDNYFADKWWNLHQRQVDWDDAAKDVVCRAMASMDRNVFSTRWLRDRYLKEYRRRLGKKHLPELFVCRNHIPRAAWPERDEGDGRVRVGFMGSGSHVWDVQATYAAIHAAKTYTDATTTMIGYNPARPDKEEDILIELDGKEVEMRSEKSKRFRDGWAKVVDTHIPWIDPGEYRRAPLPLDIGLAPIARADDFTMGKSDAKALEYTISGAACVLSSAGIYTQGGWEHEVNCLLANSGQEFAEATLRLINDEKLRYELVTAAQDMVFNDRCETQMREEWCAALEC